jgi:predicted Zn-dependent protease
MRGEVSSAKHANKSDKEVCSGSNGDNEGFKVTVISKLAEDSVTGSELSAGKLEETNIRARQVDK